MTSNKTASVLKATGVVVIIIAAIGGIVLGITNKMFVPLYSGSSYMKEQFNWILMIQTWVSGFAVGIVLFALGEMISLQQILVNKIVGKEQHEDEQVIQKSATTQKEWDDFASFKNNE